VKNIQTDILVIVFVDDVLYGVGTVKDLVRFLLTPIIMEGEKLLELTHSHLLAKCYALYKDYG
jgi:hypothetical protein